MRCLRLHVLKKTTLAFLFPLPCDVTVSSMGRVGTSFLLENQNILFELIPLKRIRIGRDSGRESGIITLYRLEANKRNLRN